MQNGSDFPLKESQYWTSHNQVITHAPDGTEIYVDEDICELLETLWGLGYTTAFSCSGGKSTNPAKPLADKSQKGYIYFETESMAENFMETAGKSLPLKRYSYYLETHGGLQGKVIYFHERMIPLFLKAFKKDGIHLAAESSKQMA